MALKNCAHKSLSHMLILYPRMIMAPLHWICTLQSVCGSKKQTLCFTHGREAFQFTFKEQVPSHQCFSGSTPVTKEKAYGSALRKRNLLLVRSGPGAWEHQFFPRWDEAQLSSEEEQKSYVPLQPCLNSSAGTGRVKRRKPYVSCLWKYQIRLISNLCSMRSVLLV